MEEKAGFPEGFFDKWLIDQDVRHPFVTDQSAELIQWYPYEDAGSTGYIRYVIRGTQLIILDQVKV